MLSNLEVKTTHCANDASQVTDFFACLFRQYDNRGFVLNIDSFPGTVQVQGNAFKRNMAYIKDYIVEENAYIDEFLEIGEIKYSDFERQLGQVFFKYCDLTTWRGQYLSNKLADPSGEFNDLDFVREYESVSTLIIEANRGPIIIKDNLFEENIGTMGGKIHIMSPDFESTAA